MMKKLLATCALLFTAGFVMNATAQCTPDAQYTQAGIYPDSATGLPAAVALMPYAETVTVVVPVDTVVEVIPGFPQTLSMDSIVITNVSGMPPGFTYACNVSNCAFPGGQSNCLIITGNPVLADTGNYPLDVELNAYVGGTGVPVPATVGYYFIDVLATTPPPGFEENTLSSFQLRQNTPNPFSNETMIRFHSENVQNVQFTVIDLLGKTVHSEDIKSVIGTNVIRLDADEFRKGVYMYSLSNGTEQATRRMIVK